MDDRKTKILGSAALLLVLIGAAALAMGDIKPGQDTDKTENPGETLEENKLLPETTNKTTIYFFWGDGCPHCARAKPFLEELDQKYEGLEVQMYEVYNSKKNQRIYQNTAERYGTRARGVPGTFLGEEHWIGYSESIGEEIESRAEECLENSCEDPLKN